MKIAIGCDHGGYSLKGSIIDLLKGLGHEVVDQLVNRLPAIGGRHLREDVVFAKNVT